MGKTKIPDQATKLLDAISSLKRAAGISNHPDHPDVWKDDSALLGGGHCLIFTTDLESAEKFSKLAKKALSHRHTPKFWKTHYGAHDQVSIGMLDETSYRIKMPANEMYLGEIIEQIEKGTHILAATGAGKTPSQSR